VSLIFICKKNQEKMLIICLGWIFKSPLPI
jgi:hypothetical protein